MLTWLDRLSMGPAIFITLLLGLAPLIPEPHLWEKLRMLFSGSLTQPLDVFDLFLHSTPAILLAIKWVRRRQNP